MKLIAGNWTIWLNPESLVSLSADLRWANGNQTMLSSSAAYPRQFGRAVLFSHQCLMDEIDWTEIQSRAKVFARTLVDELPTPGVLALEAR